MKKLTLLVAALAALLVTVAPAGAVTDGELDGDGHPYVGLMVAQDAEGNPLWRCSGTLISPTLYLTAGHCTEAPAARAEIWFDADVESGADASASSCSTRRRLERDRRRHVVRPERHVRRHRGRLPRRPGGRSRLDRELRLGQEEEVGG